MAPKIVEAPDGKMIEFPEDMADSMINLVMAKQYPVTKDAAPNRYSDDIRKGMSNIARPVLEYGGMMGGSLAAGGPLTPTGIAGAGLGYAGGNLASNYLDEKMGLRQPPDMLGRVQQTGQAATEGALMEMGGGIAGNLLSRGGAAIAKSGLPEWLYSKGIKTPMSEAWKRTIPGTDWTYRENAVKTGLEEGISASNYGKQNLLNKKASVENSRAGVISDLEKDYLETGAYRTPSSEVRSVLDDLKYEAKFSTHPEDASGALQRIDEVIQRAAGVKSFFSPKELHTLKRNFQADVNYDRVNKLLDSSGRLSEAGISKVATEAMSALETINPSLKYLNKKDQSYILLQKSIENTLARYENSPTVPLSSKMLLLRNIGLGALDVVTGTPALKTSLAIALKQAGTKAPITKLGTDNMLNTISQKYVTGRPLMIYGNENDAN